MPVAGSLRREITEAGLRWYDYAIFAFGIFFKMAILAFVIIIWITAPATGSTWFITIAAFVAFIWTRSAFRKSGPDSAGSGAQPILKIKQSAQNFGYYDDRNETVTSELPSPRTHRFAFGSAILAFLIAPFNYLATIRSPGGTSTYFMLVAVGLGLICGALGLFIYNVRIRVMAKYRQEAIDYKSILSKIDPSDGDHLAFNELVKEISEASLNRREELVSSGDLLEAQIYAEIIDDCKRLATQ